MSLQVQFSLNGATCSVDYQCSLQELLALRSLPKDGIAIAINNEVVPRDRWPEVTITPNDNVIVVTATQGG